MKSFNIGDLQIPIPIVQGGMGIGISLSKLASAVANMGGVGVISTVGIGLVHNKVITNYKQNNIDALRFEIKKAREQTKGILGVNIMSAITNFSDMVRTSIEEGIDIIFSGAGLPLDLPKYLSKGIKTKLVPIVSSARAASIICNKWKQNFDYLPDAIVVEGPKAGGHLGFNSNDLDKTNFSLENLVQEVSKITKSIKDKFTKNIPVIAAGGIFTGKDAFKIMKHGASAVQLGTRFVATDECDAAEAFKQAFINSTNNDIEIIKSPVGMPGRAISNQFLVESGEGKRKPKSCKYHCIKTCDPKTTPYCIAEALLAAYLGNLSDGFAFSGSNVDQVLNISSVREVFKDFQTEYAQADNKA